MAADEPPFELHRPNPSTRRFAAVILFGIGGGLGAAFLLTWLLGKSDAVAGASLSDIKLMYIVTVSTGIIFGAWRGSRWKFSSTESVSPLTAEDLEPLDESVIRKENSEYHVGKRTFKALADAKECLYHTNVQRELVRKGREGKSNRAP